ncbi:MAG TPA: hypothetical protein VFR41_04115, partial [Acidimicrobiia bacterium]|nr:hypothetical protein [Acidimicrobiia bacterium]
MTTSLLLSDWRFRAALAAALAVLCSLVVAVVRMSPAGSTSPPVLSVGSASVLEGDSGGTRTMLVPITLSRPSTAPVSFQWIVTGLTATSGADMRLANGSFTFTVSTTT